jgi:hypothetical protein
MFIKAKVAHYFTNRKNTVRSNMYKIKLYIMQGGLQKGAAQ